MVHFQKYTDIYLLNIQGENLYGIYYRLLYIIISIWWEGVAAGENIKNEDLRRKN